MLENMYGLQQAAEEALPATVEIPKLHITVDETTDTYGRFVAEPFERGWGMTLGNALRRTLLNSLPGTAVTWVKIDSVLHEYSTIAYVKEEVAELLLNVKQVRLRSLANRPGRLRLEVEGEGEVRAGDIMTSSDFEIVNPELHLATLDSSKSRLSIELNVEQGTGYVPASNETGLPIGVLPVDAIFSPIRKANVKVEATRAGQHTNLERLVLEVWTDGTISPMDAVRVAANQLMERFYLFSNLEKNAGAGDGAAALGLAAGPYNTPVETLGLSARTLNCLKRAGINRVGEVLQMPKKDLLKIRNFGQKSLSELYERLEAHGLISAEVAKSAGAGGEDGDAGGGDTEESDDNEA
jgi:DNA-directed RNA polymerase subunit alpha